ncbi:MAG: hypothetical protein IKA01_09910 [Alistipes sp.]|nr:hypothetical protein [Alistipes sp.]
MTAELNAGTLFSLGGEDAFDKNKGNSLLGVANYVDIATDVASEISNALGYRAPMYTIGEIPAEGTEEVSQWLPDSLGNVVRAIGDAISGNEQDGVIIDGIEDFSGSFKMDLPKNAMLYRSSGLTDQRVRTPCECKMKVYVSNYLSDDLLGSVTNQINALDPTGLLSKVTDNLLRSGGNTRAQNALYKLRSIQETGKPFRVYTPHCVYENMILKDITISTDADTMDTLVAELTFVELLMYAPNGTISKIADRKSVIKTDQQGLLRKWVGV